MNFSHGAVFEHQLRISETSVVRGKHDVNKQKERAYAYRFHFLSQNFPSLKNLFDTSSEKRLDMYL